VKIVKNQVAPPFNFADFYLVFGEGSSREGGIIDMGAETGILAKSGAWYSYNGERLGQGRENVKDFLRQHPDISREIENKIREKVLNTAKDSSRSDESVYLPDADCDE
jgi:recombination protein RecA